MSDKTSQPQQRAASEPADPERAGKGHVAAEVESASHRGAESAADKPAPHDTPHEVEGSPVRNPADLERSGRPGSTNKATRQLPP
jgi:hypothetical protein